MQNWAGFNGGFLKQDFFHHEIPQEAVGVCVEHPVLFVLPDSAGKREVGAADLPVAGDLLPTWVGRKWEVFRGMLTGGALLREDPYKHPRLEVGWS